MAEIDVSPVQIQDPKSKDFMADLFGEEIYVVSYYGLLKGEVNGCDVIVSRTGFSGEDGFEIYLYDSSSNAERFWYHLLEAGEPYSLKVIAPSHIRRIEAGILSYQQDLDIETNPYEVGLNWQVDLNKSVFVGKDALARIESEGVTRKLAGLRFARC